MAREKSKAIVLITQQGFGINDHRHNDRYFGFCQFEAEGVFLENGSIGPAIRAIKFADAELAALQLDLIDPVFVAVQCQQTCVAINADRLDCCDNFIRPKPVIRVVAHALRS